MSRIVSRTVIPMAVLFALSAVASVHAVTLGTGDIVSGGTGSNYIAQTTSGGTSTLISSPSQEVYDVAISGQTVYYVRKVAFGGAFVESVDAGTGVVNNGPINNGSEQISHVFVHSSGDVYVTDHEGSGEMRKYAGDLSSGGIFVSQGTMAGDTPAAMIEDPTGATDDIWFVEADTGGRLRKVTTGGAVSDIATLGDRPHGLAYDGVSGNLVISFEGTDSLEYWTTGGVFVSTISSGGLLTGNPRDVTLPGDGFAYVAAETGDIVKIDLGTGAQSSLDSGAPLGTIIRGVDSVPGAVPEPSSFVLAAFGLMGLGWFGVRRRKG